MYLYKYIYITKIVNTIIHINNLQYLINNKYLYIYKVCVLIKCIFWPIKQNL